MADKPAEDHDEKKDIYKLFDGIREDLVTDEEEQDAKGGSEQKGKGKLSVRLGLKKIFGNRSEKQVSVVSESEDAPFAIKEDPNDDLKERLALESYGNTDDFLDEEDREEDTPDETQEPDSSVSIAPSRLKDVVDEHSSLIRAEILEGYSDEELQDDGEKVFSKKRKLGFWLLLWVIFVGLLTVALYFLFLNNLNEREIQVVEDVLPTKTPYAEGPVPSFIELPGGWAFELSKGAVNMDGRWVPFGAEWLKGTEVCRWVALPWSIQLEAVIRTLREGDEIRLKMSNYDILTYRVEAVSLIGDDVQPEDLNMAIPSIVVLLAHSDSDQQWVLTGVLEHGENK